jgi:hypothetical protein
MYLYIYVFTYITHKYNYVKPMYLLIIIMCIYILISYWFKQKLTNAYIIIKTKSLFIMRLKKYSVFCESFL